jgi:hypothetical protein
MPRRQDAAGASRSPGRFRARRALVDIDARCSCPPPGDLDGGVGRTDPERIPAADPAMSRRPHQPPPRARQSRRSGRRGPEWGPRRARARACDHRPPFAGMQDANDGHAPSLLHPCGHLRLAVGQEPPPPQGQPASLSYSSASLVDSRSARGPRNRKKLTTLKIRSPFRSSQLAVSVAEVAELLDEPSLDACLLAHLAHRRLGGGLAGVDVALRQRPDALLAARTDRRDHRPAANRPHEHAAGRELALHGSVLPAGSCVARVPNVEWSRHSRGESARNSH